MLGFVKKCFCENFLLKARDVFAPGGVFNNTRSARNLNLEAARKYLEKYLCELKLHFSLNDNDIQKLLMTTYRSNKPQSPFVKYLSMIKYWN